MLQVVNKQISVTNSNRVNSKKVTSLRINKSRNKKKTNQKGYRNQLGKVEKLSITAYSSKSSSIEKRSTYLVEEQQNKTERKQIVSVYSVHFLFMY